MMRWRGAGRKGGGTKIEKAPFAGFSRPNPVSQLTV